MSNASQTKGKEHFAIFIPPPILSLGHAMMGIGLLLYLISVDSNVFGLQNSILPNFISLYFFGGIACNVACANIVIKR